MKIAKCLWIIISLMIVLCVDFQIAQANTEFQNNYDYFRFELDNQNNYVNLGTLNDSSLKKLETEVLENNIAPDEIIFRNYLGLFIPFRKMDERNWGIFFEGISNAQISGDSADFYRDFDSSTTMSNGRFYNIGTYSQRYISTGVYCLNKINFENANLGWSSKIFALANYQELEGNGQGIIKVDLNNSKEAELHAVYRRERTTEGNIGVGLSFDWNTSMSIGQKGGFNLNVLNLPGIVYFSELEIENGRVDAIQEIKGPVVINGFAKTENCFVYLPVLTQIEFFYASFGGTFNLNANSSGKISDFSVGYQRNINEKLKYSINFNPHMESLGLGCDWFGGKINLWISTDNWEPRGIVLKLNF